MKCNMTKEYIKNIKKQIDKIEMGLKEMKLGPYELIIISAVSIQSVFNARRNKLTSSEEDIRILQGLKNTPKSIFKENYLDLELDGVSKELTCEIILMLV